MKCVATGRSGKQKNPFMKYIFIYDVYGSVRVSVARGITIRPSIRLASWRKIWPTIWLTIRLAYLSDFSTDHFAAYFIDAVVYTMVFSNLRCSWATLVSLPRVFFFLLTYFSCVVG